MKPSDAFGYVAIPLMLASAVVGLFACFHGPIILAGVFIGLVSSFALTCVVSLVFEGVGQ